MPNPLKFVKATIAAGESLSAVADIGADSIVGLVMPDEWTPAVVSIEASSDGQVFLPLYDGHAEWTFNVVPNSIHAIHPDAIRCARFIKLRSGTFDDSVPQESEAMFRIITEAAQPAAEEPPPAEARRNR